MTQVSSLPVELLADIAKYLAPHTPIIGHNAAWAHSDGLLNWWDGYYRTTIPLDSGSNSSTNTSWNEATVSPYESLLALRQVNKQFNAICIPLLYDVVNFLGRRDGSVAEEVVSLYHRHFRVVRIMAGPLRKLYRTLLPLLTEKVTALGVYFDVSHVVELEGFIDEIIRVLGTGRVTSFGIYSTSAFTRFPDSIPPFGASILLQQVTVVTPVLRRLKSLDIVMERMDEGPYDAFRTQIGQLGSLTVRAAFNGDLGPLWDMKQRDKWFTCNNFTSLQLIQCVAASAPHIPHILQFFPLLRALTLVSCGDEEDIEPPQREKGWSFTKDSLWRGRAPLESFHLEHVFDWEIATLGAIHARQLTIAVVVEEGLINPFRDEEIYSCLQILRTEGRYITSDLERICARRGIVLESNARPLLFHA